MLGQPVHFSFSKQVIPDTRDTPIFKSSWQEGHQKKKKKASLVGVRKRTFWPSRVEAPSIASPDRDQAWSEPFKLWIELSLSPSCKLGMRPKSQFSDSWAQHLSAGVWNKLIFFFLMALITEEIRYFSLIYLVSTLATWCKEWTHWKRPWCWERLKVEGEGDDRGWDGWMASPTLWTWVWASSRS